MSGHSSRDINISINDFIVKAIFVYGISRRSATIAFARTTGNLVDRRIWVKGSMSLLQTSPNTAKRYMNLRLVMLAMSVKFES